ncbi:hypothetical protein Goari_025392 [Gossypium aridum]|uniref:Uncharacterized protein n=1 Tax=Gossypium aridum TaxID=34290 RepID=A0A7J8X917_GOSAI|nr:hypothetical protein [Gossypium aridum]
MQHKIEFFPSYAFSVLDDFIKDVGLNSYYSSLKTGFLGQVVTGSADAETSKIRGIIAYDNTLWYKLVAQAEKEVVEDLIKRYQNFVIEFNSFITAHSRVDSRYFPSAMDSPSVGVMMQVSRLKIRLMNMMGSNFLKAQ